MDNKITNNKDVFLKIGAIWIFALGFVLAITRIHPSFGVFAFFLLLVWGAYWSINFLNKESKEIENKNNKNNKSDSSE